MDALKSLLEYYCWKHIIINAFKPKKQISKNSLTHFRGTAPRYLLTQRRTNMGGLVVTI
jgi:hypothetical protein